MGPLHQSLLAAAALFFAPSSALPWGGDCDQCDRQRDSTPTLPLSEINNNVTTPLPTPTGPPKYIELGLGFQNYSCNATPSKPNGTWIQTVPSSGAVADLYDITNLVNKYTSDSITKTTLQAFERCLGVTGCTPSESNGFCDSCHKIAAAAYDSSERGFHFFAPINSAQTPNFNIYGECDFLSAKRSAAVKAPAAAYDGSNTLGAIDWLYLVDNGDGLTKNLKSVYRVETAGGVAPSSCTTPGGLLQIPYAAEYWFYN